MNLRLLLAAALLLPALAIATPTASACRSPIYVVEHYVCEGQLPCASVNCILGNDIVRCLVVDGQFYATYNWFDFDPLHDQLPGSPCTIPLA
ncbi:MAG: hypothetical protein QOE90_1585 [Thermoplasmata archaeon]|jgi:hypothetical protein|nr:hypothetical protein [Thermoplasmata archaeon]